tara:strand:- start:29 stop:448 length:420 start_codon:yes stop_codon:yes gene_type:complete
MASTLKIDNIIGVTTAGSITVTGEGNSTTTNLQQGLVKSWIKPASDLASISDSFNVSSLDDDGTGDGGVHITNDMSSANYVILGLTQDGGTSTFTRQADITDGTQAAGTYDFEVYAISSSQNRTNTDAQAFLATTGDLA